jgi:hypothetical protein
MQAKLGEEKEITNRFDTFLMKFFLYLPDFSTFTSARRRGNHDRTLVFITFDYSNPRENWLKKSKN